jgi:hypothetical protein
MIENSRDNVEKMFFLTRTDGVEISSFEEVFNCANQCLLDTRRPDLEFDRFGRNYLDRQFVGLCQVIYIYLLCNQDIFQSLSCKKDGNKYIVRLQLSNETLESELTEMVELIAQRCREDRNTN